LRSEERTYTSGSRDRRLQRGSLLGTWDSGREGICWRIDAASVIRESLAGPCECADCYSVIVAMGINEVYFRRCGAEKGGLIGATDGPSDPVLIPLHLHPTLIHRKVVPAPNATNDLY
jgi:hypothetical protein